MPCLTGDVGVQVRTGLDGVVAHPNDLLHRQLQPDIVSCQAQRPAGRVDECLRAAAVSGLKSAGVSDSRQSAQNRSHKAWRRAS